MTNTAPTKDAEVNAIFLRRTHASLCIPNPTCGITLGMLLFDASLCVTFVDLNGEDVSPFVSSHIV